MEIITLVDGIQIRRISQVDPTYQQVLSIRNRVLSQPLRADIYSIDLSDEVNDVVLIAERVLNECENNNNLALGNCVIGCVMLKFLDARTYRVKQMAVIPEERGKNIGKLLSEAAETWIARNDASRIYILSRATSVGFYEKMGYQLISQKIIHDHGLQYMEMDKYLEGRISF